MPWVSEMTAERLQLDAKAETTVYGWEAGSDLQSSGTWQPLLGQDWSVVELVDADCPLAKMMLSVRLAAKPYQYPHWTWTY